MQVKWLDSHWTEYVHSPNLYSDQAGARFYNTSVQRLVYSSLGQQYNWAKCKVYVPQISTKTLQLTRLCLDYNYLRHSTHKDDINQTNMTWLIWKEKRLPYVHQVLYIYTQSQIQKIPLFGLRSSVFVATPQLGQCRKFTQVVFMAAHSLSMLLRWFIKLSFFLLSLSFFVVEVWEALLASEKGYVKNISENEKR